MLLFGNGNGNGHSTAPLPPIDLEATPDLRTATFALG